MAPLRGEEQARFSNPITGACIWLPAFAGMSGEDRMARQVYAGMRKDGGPIGFWVYIMASQRNGTIYTGHTDDLGRRVHEHRQGLIPGFTADNNCKTLVWAEWHETREGAFIREKRIKNWRRSWKLMLIEEINPTWKDMLDHYGSN